MMQHVTWRSWPEGYFVHDHTGTTSFTAVDDENLSHSKTNQRSTYVGLHIIDFTAFCTLNMQNLTIGLLACRLISRTVRLVCPSVCLSVGLSIPCGLLTLQQNQREAIDVRRKSCVWCSMHILFSSYAHYVLLAWLQLSVQFSRS